MKKRPAYGKVSLRGVARLKRKRRKAQKITLEQEYVRLFQSNRLADQGFLAENENLEQPSPLKDYPSTATPGVGVSIELPLRQHAKLEPVIH